MSITFLVSKFKKYTIPNTTIIATNEEGTAFVSRGNKTTINIVTKVNPAIKYNAEPCNHSLEPLSVILNCATCDIKIMTANPFKKPYMTGCGIKRTNLPNLKAPTDTCKIPARATAANKYSTPYVATKAIKTTTVAPAPPDTIPGRPPKTAVTNPIKKAAYNPVSGDNPAKIAKDNDSGIMVMATVKPAKTSFL